MSLIKITLTLCIALVILSFAASQTPATSDSNTKVIIVTGQGKGSAKQTLAEIRVGVEAEAQTANAAQNEVATKAQQAVTALQSNTKIQNLQTTSISLYPVYNNPTNPNDKSQIVGYRASTTLSFKVTEIQQLGSILDSVVQLGINKIYGLNLKPEDAAVAKARRDALQAATQDALEKAQVVLSTVLPGSNVKASEVIEVNISNGDYYPIATPSYALAADSRASIPVVSGEDEVQATVTLKIRY
ncbi:hypothetical protein ABK040_004106 [Willaertia magna]